MTSAFFKTFALAAAALSPLLTATLSYSQVSGSTVVAAHPAASRLDAAYANLPLAFEPNRGQTDEHVQFVARAPQATVFLTGSDAVLETSHMQRGPHGVASIASTASVRMHLLGAASAPVLSPEQTLGGTVSYMKGNDRSQWQTGLPTYSGVLLSSVYPGIDLRYYGHTGQLEYDFIVEPNADPNAVKLQFQGTDAQLDTNGDLRLPVGMAGDLRFARPVAYQTVGGKRVNVEASFAMNANREVTFKLGAYDHNQQLTIDPTLIYLGTIGTGIGQVDVSQITVDSAGALYFIGTTNDATYPVTSGAYQTVCGPANATAAGNNVTYCTGNYTAAFVTKLSADGTKLVYSTYLSGHSGVERGSSIAVDAAGVAYLLGATSSNDFPVTADAFQKLCLPAQPPGFEPAPVTPTSQCDNFANGGGTEYTINGPVFFFAKLNATGSALLYASFLGGSLPAYPISTALDAGGNWYLFGQSAALLPRDIYGNGGGNVQFPGITSSGYQQFSNELGGPGGNPSTADVGAVLSKFSNDGHTLLYGSFLNDPKYDINYFPQSLALGANGYVFVGGTTQSASLPTTAGAIKGACTVVDPNSNGTLCTTVDGFIAAFDTTKSGAASLAALTRLGGTDTGQGSNIQQQQVLGLTADLGTNNIYATGYTFDHGFPIPSNGYQHTCPNYDATKDTYDYCNSAYVIELNPSLTAVLGGSFLVGPNFRSSGSTGYNVRLDSKKQVYLYGVSNDGGGDFPQVNALQGYKGGNQLFISTFSADMSKLLFSTRFGNTANTNSSVKPAGGMVLDANDNIYFAGTTNDTTFAGTPGTYVTAATTGQGDHTFFAKLSKVLQPDTTTLTIAPNPVSQNAAITYKAVVTGTFQTTPAATGTVTFSAANTTPATVLGTATLDGTGTATLSTTAPTAGSYTVVASYGADTVYDVSTSTSVPLVVNNTAATTTTLTATPSAARSGATVTLNVTVAGANGTPTGTVTFLDGTSTLGTATLAGGSASFTTASLSATSHSITARYSGDNSFAASTSAAQTVVVTANTVAVGLTATPAVSPTGGTVTLSASLTGATSTTAPTGKVTFYNGTTVLGMVTVVNNAAVLATTMLPAGPASLTAVYSGDALYSMVTSSAQNVVVRSPAATTTTLSSSSASVTAGTSITFTATISSSVTTGTPSGTVTFMDGSTVLGMGTVNGGVATYATSALGVAVHSITAVYSGDSLFLTSSSAAFTQTVIVATIALTTPSTSLTVSRGQSLTAIISATPNGSYTGSLNFACGTLPAYASCSFAPAVLVFSGTSTVQTTTLTFSTKSATSALLRRENFGSSAVNALAASFFIPLGVLGMAYRRRKSNLRNLGLFTLLLAISFGAIGLTGCAGSSSPTTATGTYMVPVTATVNGTTTALNLNITVQ